MVGEAETPNLIRYSFSPDTFPQKYGSLDPVVHSEDLRQQFVQVKALQTDQFH